MKKSSHQVTVRDNPRDAADMKKVRMTGMNVEELAGRTRKDLLVIAKRQKIKGVSRLRKADLLDRVIATLSPPPPATTPTVSASVIPATVPTPLPPFLPTPTSVAAEQPLAPSDREYAAEAEQEAADSKFFLGPQPHIVVSEPDALPGSYNDNRIVLLARDPHWLYAYWDFSGEHFSKARNQLAATDERLVLRIFDVTYIEFNGANAWSSRDFELTPFATSWYISVPQADAAYCAEIGYRAPDGRFVSLGRSNVISTPRAEVSPSTTVRWFIPPERRAVVTHASHAPRSSLTQDQAAGTSGHGPTLPAPSSAEHPFSWGAVRKQ
jgi:hypothetical protein